MADLGIGESLALAGTVASVAAAGASAVAQSNAQKYNEQVANNNATAASQQAAYANSLKQIQLERTLGAERAAAGASGVDGGSLQSVEYNTLVMGKYDQLATTYEGQVQSTRSQSEAQLDAMGSTNALYGGAASAVGSGLSGGAKAYAIGANASGTGQQPDFEGGSY